MGIPVMGAFLRHNRVIPMRGDKATPLEHEAALDVARMMPAAVSVDIQNVADLYQGHAHSDDVFIPSAIGREGLLSPWPVACFEFRWHNADSPLALLLAEGEVDENGARRYNAAILILPNGQAVPPQLLGCSDWTADSSGYIEYGKDGLFLHGEEQGFLDWSFDLVEVAKRISLFAIAFANCQNVQIVEDSGLYPSRQARRAAERRGEPKPPRFYTLRINPNAMRKQAESSGAASGRELSLHIVRGHFATYTEERPLFGKYSGTFWVPSHVRGSQDAGIVGKDYSIG